LSVFSDPRFQRELLIALAAGEADRVRATAARIRDGDPESWLAEWTASGGDAWAAGRYRHAAASYAAALALIDATDGTVDAEALEKRCRACADRAAPLADVLPDGARAALAAADRERFDRELHLAELFAPGTESYLRRAAGEGDRSLFDVLREALQA
jgi:hypothetical protein